MNKDKYQMNQDQVNQVTQMINDLIMETAKDTAKKINAIELMPESQKCIATCSTLAAAFHYTVIICSEVLGINDRETQKIYARQLLDSVMEKLEYIGDKSKDE